MDGRRLIAFFAGILIGLGLSPVLGWRSGLVGAGVYSALFAVLR